MGFSFQTPAANVDELFSTMATVFAQKRGNADVYIGLRITRNGLTHELLLDQSHFLTRIFHKFGFEVAAPLAVPADPYTHLSVADGTELFLIRFFLVRL